MGDSVSKKGIYQTARSVQLLPCFLALHVTSSANVNPPEQEGPNKSVLKSMPTKLVIAGGLGGLSSALCEIHQMAGTGIMNSFSFFPRTGICVYSVIILLCKLSPLSFITNKSPYDPCGTTDPTHTQYALGNSYILDSYFHF